MCIGTIIPTPYVHAVKPLWSENTKPSVIVAVNGLIGRNTKMQKWYIRAGVGQTQMKTTNKSVKLNSHNILKSRCTRSHTKLGTNSLYQIWYKTGKPANKCQALICKKRGLFIAIKNEHDNKACKTNNFADWGCAALRCCESRCHPFMPSLA